jgi:DNA N-6-adenine-methyltransferase (Dam)
LQPWTGTVWCNPPYGKEIAHWVRKAYTVGLEGVTVVMLLPVRTDTRWWHSYVMNGKLTFIKGRLKFGGYRNSAPFASAVVVFGEKGGA